MCSEHAQAGEGDTAGHVCVNVVAEGSACSRRAEIWAKSAQEPQRRPPGPCSAPAKPREKGAGSQPAPQGCCEPEAPSGSYMCPSHGRPGAATAKPRRPDCGAGHKGSLFSPILEAGRLRSRCQQSRTPSTGGAFVSLPGADGAFQSGAFLHRRVLPACPSVTTWSLRWCVCLYVSSQQDI